MKKGVAHPQNLHGSEIDAPRNIIYISNVWLKGFANDMFSFQYLRMEWRNQAARRFREAYEQARDDGGPQAAEFSTLAARLANHYSEENKHALLPFLVLSWAIFAPLSLLFIYADLDFGGQSGVELLSTLVLTSIAYFALTEFPALLNWMALTQLKKKRERYFAKWNSSGTEYKKSVMAARSLCGKASSYNLIPFEGSSGIWIRADLYQPFSYYKNAHERHIDRISFDSSAENIKQAVYELRQTISSIEKDLRERNLA